MDDLLEMCRELTEALGVPGQEDEVRGIMAHRLAPYGEVLRDALGSVAVRKVGRSAEGDGPRILIAGHLDEVGYMVTRITDEGFLKFQPLGG